jgi:hypothetical protein
LPLIVNVPATLALTQEARRRVEQTLDPDKRVALDTAAESVYSALLPHLRHRTAALPEEVQPHYILLKETMA